MDFLCIDTNEQTTIPFDAKREENEVEMLIKERYSGNIPPVGIGYQNYLKRIDEIEQKVMNGYYTKQLQIERKEKLKKYSALYEKFMKKAITDNELKKQKYIEIAQKLQKKIDKIKNMK
jgi:hypothetical protein